MRIAPCWLFILTFFALPDGVLYAQRSAGTESNIDPLFLIDVPIAGLIPTTAGSVETLLYAHGGVLVSLTYGLQKGLNVGLSFGGTGIIGSGGIQWNKLPGISVRYRFLDETVLFPAVILGLDTQGKDGYLPEWKQYLVKSPGVFLAASKNYHFYGTVSFHGGINYTLERHDKDMSPNLFLGSEKTLGPLLSILGEYNFAFDNDKQMKGFWNGSLNVGLRVSTNIGFNADFQFKNLLCSSLFSSKVSRAIRIQYVRYF